MIVVKSLLYFRGAQSTFLLKSCCIHLSAWQSSDSNKKHCPTLPAEMVEELITNATSEESRGSSEDMWLKSAYEIVDSRKQSSKALRPKVNPATTTILLFPGQGVQYVGMGKPLLHIPSVKDIFKRANEILGYDLLQLCLNGPIEKLNKTVYCQPAVFVASLAGLQYMIEEHKYALETCVATAGFSVGEYAALVFAGVIKFEQALKLVKIRAEAMQTLSDRVPSGLATLFLEPGASIGNITQKAVEWCVQRGVDHPVCEIANYLWPHCKVIGGNVKALEFIEQNSTQLKIRKVRRIPVSGAFHTQLMKPAASVLAEALKNCDIEYPQISVHSNVDALPYHSPNIIRKKLPQQVYKPVKWEQIMHIIYEREKGVVFPRTFECGPRNSLTTMLRFLNKPASLEARNIEV